MCVVKIYIGETHLVFKPQEGALHVDEKIREKYFWSDS